MKSFDELTGRARERPQEESVVKSRFKVTKANDEKMQVFGWASVSIDESGNQLEDWQGDMIDPEELEQAAYHAGFVSQKVSSFLISLPPPLT